MAGVYKQTIPVFVKYLRALSHIMQKGAKFTQESQTMTEESMLTFRLIADMRGLPYQVQSCCNTAKFLAERLGNKEAQFFEDNETTFEQLESRIQKTIEYLEKADATAIDESADREIIMETKMGNFKFTNGQTYASEYAIPNFHFHLTSAYCILRHLGVPLGALDYLKDVFHKA